MLTEGSLVTSHIVLPTKSFPLSLKCLISLQAHAPFFFNKLESICKYVGKLPSASIVKSSLTFASGTLNSKLSMSFNFSTHDDIKTNMYSLSFIGEEAR